MNFQELILRLHNFWGQQACIIQQPYDVEKGAGTMNPATFLRALGPGPGRWLMLSPHAVPLTGGMGKTPTACSIIISTRLFSNPPRIM